jgi:hypothetical protein
MVPSWDADFKANSSAIKDFRVTLGSKNPLLTRPSLARAYTFDISFYRSYVTLVPQYLRTISIILRIRYGILR